MNTKYLVWVVVGVALAALIIGVIAAGSPAQVRLQKIDGQRVNALQNIQWQIISFWQTNERLPKTVDELVVKGGSAPYDPVTKKPYEYKVTGEKAFELCATFTTEVNETRLMEIPQNERWDHKAGEVCFERIVSEELYPFMRTGKPVPVY